MTSLPRTLILDYRDSYTNNLLTLFVQLFSDQEVARQVVIVQADSLTWEECQHALTQVDCVILSPGPGRPDNPEDVGYALDLIRTIEIPLLGICLGLQSLAVAYGGKIINTPNLRHGHLIDIHHSSQPIFDLVPETTSASSDPIKVVAYNSLTVDPHSLPEELEVIACAREVLPAHDGGQTREVMIVQGLAHRTKPQWGVQFHPESIASSHGSDILRSFLNRVRDHHHASTFPALSAQLPARSSTAIKCSVGDREGEAAEDEKPTKTEPFQASLRLVHEFVYEEDAKAVALNVPAVFDRLFREKCSSLGQVWLDGVSPNASTTSSMAIPSFILTYSTESRTVTIVTDSLPADRSHSIPLPAGVSFWEWFAQGQATLKAALAPGLNDQDDMEEGVAWRGGWVGWWGYEMKAESLGGYHAPEPRNDLTNGHAGAGRVDACWAWCDRILQRRSDGKWLARGIVRAGDILGEATGMLASLAQTGVSIGLDAQEWSTWTKDLSESLSTSSTSHPARDPVEMPSFRPDCTAGSYKAGIERCRDAIYAGDSYELTLTTTFSADSPPLSTDDGFALYTQLRVRNPAPYSAYFHFPCLETTILSSSPERFLRIDRGGNIQMKPIKGTRRRARCTCGSLTAGCAGPGGPECAAEMATRDVAIGEGLRTDEKERAENLMIVDLIRSDLQSCCVSSSVRVPKLIALETYETVHQLVTTVTGKLEDGVDEIQAVRRCFPPGSMTGAPKLRSVQILDELEGYHSRGIYSGAMGYMSIDGAVDLSVVIRTIVMDPSNVVESDCAKPVKPCEETTTRPRTRRMRIGAGGAITWLSDPQREWEEVLTKVGSVTGR